LDDDLAHDARSALDHLVVDHLHIGQHIGVPHARRCSSPLMARMCASL
jgi:hypothetical protein